jgi:N-acetylglucosaminyldiphosphoundecaprenol N-acetyl-beta-D-mannosaminyltransferase
MIKNYPLSHIKVSAVSIDDAMRCVESFIINGKKAYCIPVNLSKYAMSKKDTKLREVINSADLVIPDGIPIVYLGMRAGCEGINRITGIEFAESILSLSKEKGWKIYLLGASPQNIDLARSNVCKSFNDPLIVGFHHGYFSRQEVNQIVEAINDSGAEILLLGMGLPQKEYFIGDNIDKLNIKFCLPVGGAFDIWAGKKKRSPEIFNILGFEWLYRSLYDKSRAWLIMRYSLIFIKDFISLKR